MHKHSDGTQPMPLRWEALGLGPGPRPEVLWQGRGQQGAVSTELTAPKRTVSVAGAVPCGDSVQLCCPTTVECQPQVLWLFLVAMVKKNKIKGKKETGKINFNNTFWLTQSIQYHHSHMCGSLHSFSM